MPQEAAPKWVKPVMRIGYAARGVTYLMIGGLAVLAAWTGGQAEGTKGALAQLRDEPLGLTALIAIGIGLLAYSVWRLICAWYDLEDQGSGFKAFIARTGQAVTGLIHLGLGISVLRLALGSGGGQDGSAPQSLTSRLLAMEYGKIIVMGIGLVVIGAGIYYGYKGIAEKYKEHIRLTRVTERLDPALKAGLVAHGIVIALIGGFLLYAGQTTDPGEAGGIGKAFQVVREQPFGRILLGLLGLGTVGFAIYCFVEACYRIIPRLAGDDISSLATRAKAKAEQKARQATA
ncbi:hypothetical protein OB2597_07000 [Pseudooceanicola batsensis HTCC2597]|uniref:DUF1206 domain-containing protein n=1 Tax=Pseudooceanicola batsensis (strain ATCC BAA-863 / DSM 15984 / KCTC 12145 / HTCC2597) TaxID=252305 RepID=A3TTN5_PSEBH|nr:DUF1206 domain-containing protein [Pseudooceanicola batsensis]EAQ05012.1 hypothetical protein OB2597_07000 [Pseudooceanicola batsensis HTCC2597]